MNLNFKKAISHYDDFINRRLINKSNKPSYIEIVETNVVFRTRRHGVSKWKNNLKTFINHIFFNFIYLFQLRLSKIKK